MRRIFDIPQFYKKLDKTIEVFTSRIIYVENM